MERITYAMVIQFFTHKKKYRNGDVAEWLELDKGSLSGIISGSRQLKRDITRGMFFDQVFVDMPHLSKANTDDLYDFLGEQDALSPMLSELYLQCEEAGRTQQKKTCEAFVRAVLQEADRAREDKIPGKKIGGRAKERAPEVRFAPFANPVIQVFIGRGDLLRRIGEVLTQHSVSVICGIGGLGKSQAALAYAKEGQEKGIYQQVQCVFFEGSLSDTLLRIPLEGRPTIRMRATATA